MTSSPALKRLGNAIQQNRAQRNWSQEELAERAGLHRNYVSSTERGERNIAIIYIIKIANALGMKAAELLEEAAV